MQLDGTLSRRATADLAAYRRVKLGANGWAYAGAEDKAWGTVLAPAKQHPNDDYRTNATAVKLNVGTHFATFDDNTALAVGDEIEGAANGMVSKKDAGTAIGIVVELTGAVAANAIHRVSYY